MTMMKDTFCSYAEDREALLVGYLYDDMPSEEKISFNRHLSACASCRAELAALAEVRSELGQWKAPEPASQLTFHPTAFAPAPRTISAWQRFRQVPVWAQAAAAILVLGVAAGMANLEVSYSTAGFAVRTGWRHVAAPTAVPQAGTPSPALDASAPAPWQPDLNRLANDLRAEMGAKTQSVAATASTGVPDEALVRRLRLLIQESEQRQQRELALRVGEVAREVQVQRRADLVRIDRVLGLIEGRTGMEVMRTQQQLNNIAQRVSQRPE